MQDLISALSSLEQARQDMWSTSNFDSDVQQIANDLDTVIIDLESYLRDKGY